MDPHKYILLTCDKDEKQFKQKITFSTDVAGAVGYP